MPIIVLHEVWSSHYCILELHCTVTRNNRGPCWVLMQKCNRILDYSAVDQPIYSMLCAPAWCRMQRAKIRTSLVPQLGLQTRSKLQLSCGYWIPKRNRTWSTHKSRWNWGCQGEWPKCRYLDGRKFFLHIFLHFQLYFNTVKEMLTFHISIKQIIFNPKCGFRNSQ